MGGNAFTNHLPPLKTPRMPPQTYIHVRDSVLGLLLKHYTDAKSPIEAPGKPDYGDIDVLVHGPLSPEFDPSKTNKNEIARTIGNKMFARAWIVGKGPQAINFAIKWPTRKSTHARDDGTTVESEVDDHPGCYIQVDMQICEDFKTFKWEYFHESHGDLWSILGTTIRKFGLTVNDKGMFVRIPDIELLDRKKSMVFLTDEPKDILEFLGLDHRRWFHEFSTKQEMFEYAASSRLFWPWVKSNSELEAGEMEGDVVGVFNNTTQPGNEAAKKKLKHNDRARMSKRPMYQEWMEVFIPSLRAQNKQTDSSLTREPIRDEAFSRFGVKDEWDSKLLQWKLARHNDELWRDVIKGSIPEDLDPQLRAATVREMKDIIMNGVLFLGDTPDAANKNAEGFYDFDKIREFIADNWELVGEIGWNKQLERATERMKEVNLKRDQAAPHVEIDDPKWDGPKW